MNYPKYYTFYNQCTEPKILTIANNYSEVLFTDKIYDKLHASILPNDNIITY